MRNAIECRGVGKSYPGFQLDDVELVVPEGTVMGFVGPNGAGKSTTLRILMGLTRAERGSVHVLGHPMPEHQVAAKWDIGFVSEEMRLHPGRTLGFHLKFMASIYPSWEPAYAAQLLARFDLDPARRAKDLSHGQRMKACLLMALARRPRLLILDEPTTGLDPLARRQVVEELSSVLTDERRSILFSSHNTLDVEQLSDRITFIRSGSILFSEDKETLLDSWRRIRVEVPVGVALPEVPGQVEARRSGRQVAITTREFGEALGEWLRASGLSVLAVERMTLEEIFLSSTQGDVSGKAPVKAAS